MTDLILGFDPGGEDNFGWCVAQNNPNTPLQLVEMGVADNAHDAFEGAKAIIAKVASLADVKACGIDAPLHWVDNGDRQVDKHVRDRIPQRDLASGTVQAVNSLQGACLAQGILIARLIQNACPHVKITEAHPKAAMWLLGIATNIKRPPLIGPQDSDLQKWIGPPAKLLAACASFDHKRDAAIGALTAWAMLNNALTWKNIASLETPPHRHDLISPKPEYWIPA